MTYFRNNRFSFFLKIKSSVFSFLSNPFIYLENYLNNHVHNKFGGDIMGKFKLIFIMIVALVFVCGIIMVAEAPTSFDDSMTLIPVSDSGNLNQSDCENGSCLVDSNDTHADSIKKSSSKEKDNANKKMKEKDSVDKKMNYDSKYYDGSFINGLYFCNDLDKAFKDAKAHHRNVMIIFDGAACIYCEYLKEDTLTDASVQKEINDNYIILITDTSESPELSSQLNIHGTPTTVVFDENARELGRIDGFEPPEEYLPHLKDISN